MEALQRRRATGAAIHWQVDPTAFDAPGRRVERNALWVLEASDVSLLLLPHITHSAIEEGYPQNIATCRPTEVFHEGADQPGRVGCSPSSLLAMLRKLSQCEIRKDFFFWSINIHVN